MLFRSQLQSHAPAASHALHRATVARSDADRAAVGAALGLNLSAVVPAPLRAGNPPTFVFAFFGNFQKVDPTKVTAASHFQNDLGLDSLDAV